MTKRLVNDWKPIFSSLINENVASQNNLSLINENDASNYAHKSVPTICTMFK